MGRDRDTIEAAFKCLWANQPADWPPVAERIRERRRRKRLDPIAVSTSVGVTISTYNDLEAVDDEAFTVLTLAELARLCGILDVPLRDLLLAESNGSRNQVIEFQEITRRLRQRKETEGFEIEDLSALIGWDIAPVLANSEKIWDFTVVALNDVCNAVGLDWVAALPDSGRMP